MAQIVWAPSALTDADAIAEYIARDSPDRAALFVRRLLEAVERLAEFPNSGHVIPEIGDKTCREISVTPYRVMYAVDRHTVWITGIDGTRTKRFVRVPCSRALRPLPASPERPVIAHARRLADHNHLLQGVLVCA